MTRPSRIRLAAALALLLVGSGERDAHAQKVLSEGIQELATQIAASVAVGMSGVAVSQTARPSAASRQTRSLASPIPRSCQRSASRPARATPLMPNVRLAMPNR